MPEFSQTSKDRLATCHPDQQRLWNDVIQTVDCAIICGHRDQAAQDQAFHDGFSKLQWPHGPHNSIPSLAVDAMRCPIDWHDDEGNKAFAAFVKERAQALGIAIEFGGDWPTFKDNDHYQLKAEPTC